jgi:hypothetical protein
MDVTLQMPRDVLSAFAGYNMKSTRAAAAAAAENAASLKDAFNAFAGFGIQTAAPVLGTVFPTNQL